MTDYQSSIHKGFKISFTEGLEQEDFNRIVYALKHPKKTPVKVLGGRGMMSSADLKNAGPVVIKHYQRGGIWRFFNRFYYFKMGSYRPEVEFSILQYLINAGVIVPQPVAFVTHGSLFYRGWLVTKLVPDHRSLAEMSVDSPDETRRLMAETGRIIRELIKLKVHHVDLHPGNIIVNQENQVYLLDFDKAHFFKGGSNKLRDAYLTRWRRAVIKHNLPEMLAEYMSAELRHNFDRLEQS